MSEPYRILVADDEENMRMVLREILEREGYQVAEAPDGQAAVEAADGHSFSLAILDIKMPRLDGIQALGRLRAIDPSLPVVMITAHGGRAIAMDAVRLGAYDFFEKPFDMQEMRVVVKRALERGALQRQIEALAEELRAKRAFGDIIGQSKAMRDALDLVRRVMVTDATVLITGESGTGKELIADAIHFNGSRSKAPFLKVNCAAIPDALLESELFGHEKGAFTGAVAMKPGKFELADKGTLFLDEIGEMPLALQAKILRALQEREIERVGGTRSIKVDVRIVAATNMDLAREAAARRFREDLYFRLNVVPINLPALRDRREDIPPLVEHFTRIYAAKLGKAPCMFEPAAMDLLQAYSWPGNIRELENIVQRAIILTNGPVLTVDALPPEMRRRSDAPSKSVEADSLIEAFDDLSIPMPTQVERMADKLEARLIRAALAKTDGKRQEAADLLGISRKSLHNKMLKYGLFERTTE
ncbi:MAG: Transcriptional regulatory protein ZraR [candidate division BRC1 bacterium ADurb.BinA364]|nr:MAG: Transcriptional regulatory protein ZraR [candidate division BRC1 bacterium ADurb.BinA364]